MTSIVIIGSKYYKQSTIEGFLEEYNKHFDKLIFAPIDKINISLNSEPKILYKNKNLLEHDIIYPRISANDYYLGEPLLEIIEKSKKYCPVSLKSYRITNNKFYTTYFLGKAGLPIIDSSLFVSPETAMDSIRDFGFPVVAKILSGFAGKGVVLIENEKQLSSILDTMHLYEEILSSQRFIKGKNSDIRCYVFGKEVMTVKRIGKDGDWRANISRGGRAEEIKTTDEMRSIALRTAELLQMDICAVDLIENNGKYYIIEVNFMPGPFKKFLGNKVITKMLSFLSSKV